MTLVADWPRPHFKPSGGRASLFYLVFGEPPAHLNVKRARHHVDQLPPELQVSIHARTDDAAWFDGWLSNPLGAEIPHVFETNARSVYAAGRVAAVRGEFDDPSSLAYLRNTVGVVSAIAEEGAVSVFDVHALTWWTPQEWRTRFVDRSEFHIADHIFTAVSLEETGRTVRMRTRGMKKFGRPELQLRHVPGAPDGNGRAVHHATEVLSGLANYMAHGGVIADGETMHLARFDASIAFFPAAAEPDASAHFENPTLEVCEIDPATGLSGGGISQLLGRMESAAP
ncbi:MAG TPA: hypothetical protein VFB66_18640 [Tepidisphaeraceae bacterium]|nr:hypothetical protein [Tepidisphaeraceae bacterium]